MSTGAAEAWLIHLNAGLRAAVGSREMLYVLPENFSTHKIPRSPAHAQSIVMWQEHLVPLIDLPRYVSDANYGSSQRLVGIVAVAANTGERSTTELGALWMTRPPEKIQVTNEQACALPPALQAWARISASCFRHPVHGAVPILDLASILMRA
jgi:chemotaxis signal transduction protein